MVYFREDAMKFNITLVQMPTLEGDRQANFAVAEKVLADHQSSGNVEFIILPELFAIGFRHEDYAKVGAGVPGLTEKFLLALSEMHDAYVVASGIEQSDSMYHNTLVMATPQGKVLGRYRKIHPFQEERDVFKGGKKLAMFDVAGMKVGAQICYDIRFPEVTRGLALAGAELIVIPAAFPDPRSAHWDTLVMARAIENQVYVAATNRVRFGFDGKTYFGHSQVVDPWGVRLTRINSETALFTHECNTSMINTVRDQITCYADRSPTGYSEIEWFRE
jgi:predicted amidohydrolase